MIGKKKEEERVCTVQLHVIRKSPRPSENRLTAFLNWKKPTSDLGFVPGLPRQNAIPLPLVPPPLPRKKTLMERNLDLVFCQVQKLASQSLVLGRKRFYVTQSKELTTTTKRPASNFASKNLALTLTCTKGTVRSFSTALRSGRPHLLIVSGSILSLQTGIELRSSCDRCIHNIKAPGLKGLSFKTAIGNAP